MLLEAIFPVIAIVVSFILLVFNKKIAKLQIREFEAKREKSSLIFYKKVPPLWFARFVYLFIGIGGISFGIVMLLKSF